MNPNEIDMNKRVSDHYVILKSTCDCNFDCQYCFDKPLKKAFKGQRMSLEIVEKIIELESAYAHHVTLDLFGGEPTLMPKEYYYAIYDITSQYYTTVFNLCMQSNGYIVSRDHTWIDVFEDLGIPANFSFDLTTQNLRNDNLKLEEIKAVIDEIHRRDIDGGCLLGVTNKENVRDLISIREFLKKERIFAAFNPIALSYNNGEEGLEFSVEDRFVHLRKYMLHVLRDASGELNYLERTATLHISVLLGLDKQILCDYRDCTKCWLNYMPDGTISPCSRPSAKIVERYNLGNIMDYASIEEVYQTPQYLKYLEDIAYKKENFCDKCGFYDICKGLCHTQHSHAHDGDIRFVNPKLCESFKLDMLNAYGAICELEMNDGLLAAFARELCNYYKFLPTELEYLLTKHLELDFDLSLRIDTLKYVDSPKGLLENPRFKLFMLLNKDLNADTTYHISEIDDGTHKLTETLYYKEDTFSMRLSLYKAEVESLIEQIKLEG